MAVQYAVFSRERANKYNYYIVKNVGDTDLVACLIDGIHIVVNGNSHLERLKAEADDWLKNTEVKTDSVSNIVNEPGAEELQCMQFDTQVGGAAVLLREDALKAVFEKLGEFYILPSSIHEVLLLPVDDGVSASDLRGMVKEINATKVRPAEQLSDNVYKYDGNAITIA